MTEKVQQDLKQAGEAVKATPGQVSDAAQKSAADVKEALTPKK